MICSVGAPLHKEHKEELIRHLPSRLYELYGLTEGFMTILDRNDYEMKTGSVGAPTAFFDLRIEDDRKNPVPAGQVGEIVGKGPIQMAEYYKRPEMTRQAIVNGWLYTGDMGYVDDDGFLYLVDRKKDMIISGGVNVYPKDIEEIIVQHPDVMEAAVIGIGDEKWGETPVARRYPVQRRNPHRRRIGSMDQRTGQRQIPAHSPCHFCWKIFPEMRPGKP